MTNSLKQGAEIFEMLSHVDKEGVVVSWLL